MKASHRWLPWILLVALLPLTGSTLHRIQSQQTTLHPERNLNLEGAPPSLALTSVALGGFRGLAANLLWMRTLQLQDEGNYFEVVTLSHWITQLQPELDFVWAMQAWNMTYNISIRFDNHQDRWNWVRNGIELLRDQGLRYNPRSLELYRELSWFFLDKIGSNTDLAHRTYKETWALEMARLFGHPQNLAPLLAPTTPEDAERVQTLKGTYRIDPGFLARVDQDYGPLDWRTPEAHGIYWAALGLERCAGQNDLLRLHRSLWQCLQRSFQRGQLRFNRVTKAVSFGPNLDMIPNTYRVFQKVSQIDPSQKEYVADRQMAFLKDAIFLLYTHNRIQEASGWFQVYSNLYPTSNSAAGGLDEFVVKRATEQVEGGKLNRVLALVEGLLGQHLYHGVIGEDDLSNGYALLARRVWQRYQTRHAEELDRLGLPSLEALQEKVIEQARAGQHGFTPSLLAQLGVTNTAPAATPLNP